MNTAAVTLQRLTFPDIKIPNDDALYLHLTTKARLADGTVQFNTGGCAHFDTYVNLFNLGNWAHFCRLEGLSLHLCGSGEFDLHVWHLFDGKNHTLIRQILTLTPEGNTVVLDHTSGRGLVMFSLTARTQGHLTAGHFTAPQPAQVQPVTLALVITTFQRQADIAATAARIAAHLDNPITLPGAHLFVIDNGRDVTLPAHPRLTLIPNRNLGGAGGFARGLAAAQDAGHFSHVLFMDDDATFPLESLHRTCAFLALARDPATAMVGAMLCATRPWQLWENGAVFRKACRPMFNEFDLRDTAALTAMEQSSAADKPHGFYGGWWYFAFPLAQVRHYPFPFFVRGDDVSFALSNPFRMATLNGVMSFQDDFATKASPQTAYLDLRYHLHVHLVQDGMDLSRFGTASVALKLIVGSIMRMHYESAAAQLLSWADILRGPDMFTDEITMQNRRATITQLTQTERWQPCPARPSLSVRSAPTRFASLVQKATLNGHLVPAFGRFGRSVVIPTAIRGKLWASLGAAQATCYDPSNQTAYTVHHDKAVFVRLMLKAGALTLHWLWAHKHLRDSYRNSYDAMTSRAFWDRVLQD